MTNLENQVQSALGQAITRSWQDEDYRSRLVADPVSAIREIEPSFTVAEGKTLVVRDQSQERTLYINIPAKSSLEDAELTDDQLEAIAGGRTLPKYDYTKFQSLIKYITFPTKNDEKTRI